MSDPFIKKTLRLLSVAGVACGISCAHAETLPAPVVDEAVTQDAQLRKIVVAGGCFWGVEAVFHHMKGVTQAVSGYAGGTADTADYDSVSSGATGHAEAVEVTYDPAQTSAGRILQVFFSVAHDPTTLNRQGPDHGMQYRSAVFFTTAEQEKVTRAYIQQIDNAKIFSNPIVTEVAALDQFYPAEDYHQDYVRRHPTQAYIVINDLPKVADLRSKFPEFYRDAE